MTFSELEQHPLGVLLVQAPVRPLNLQLKDIERIVVVFDSLPHDLQQCVLEHVRAWGPAISAKRRFKVERDCIVYAADDLLVLFGVTTELGKRILAEVTASCCEQVVFVPIDPSAFGTTIGCGA